MKRIQCKLFIFAISTTLLLSSCCRPLSIPIPDETPQDQYLIDNLPGCVDQPFELDENKLNILVEDIKEGDYGKIHSLLIIHYDSLVLEEYFMGWTRHMRHPWFSVTKSFSSALIGIAIEQGYIDGVNEKLLSFFPEYSDIANLDERKESITLENALTMTAGFSWDETSTPYFDECGNPNPENDSYDWALSSDWIKYTLDLPMSDDPGAKFVYNSGISHLLSGIIKNKTGKSAEEFASENLFNALGITNWEWVKDPNGFTNTDGESGGLYIHPVNMAMFGYLYFKNGLLDGEQIVPEKWVEESTDKHIVAEDLAEDLYYGYQWWYKNKAFSAIGYGGQCIYVIPGINMVVVMTAENFEDPSPREFILQYIVESLIIKS